jgi:hypothetical protein
MTHDATNGMVVIYFSQLGGRLSDHQKVMLEADAKVIAQIKRCCFGGQHYPAQDPSRPVYFVPDDTLLLDEARSLGIRTEDDLYGGAVP